MKTLAEFLSPAIKGRNFAHLSSFEITQPSISQAPMLFDDLLTWWASAVFSAHLWFFLLHAECHKSVSTSPCAWVRSFKMRGDRGQNSSCSHRHYWGNNPHRFHLASGPTERLLDVEVHVNYFSVHPGNSPASAIMASVISEFGKASAKQYVKMLGKILHGYLHLSLILPH